MVCFFSAFRTAAKTVTNMLFIFTVILLFARAFKGEFEHDS